MIVGDNVVIGHISTPSAFLELKFCQHKQREHIKWRPDKRQWLALSTCLHCLMCFEVNTVYFLNLSVWSISRSRGYTNALIEIPRKCIYFLGICGGLHRHAEAETIYWHLATFSSRFYCMKAVVFQFQFHRNLYQGVWLTISRHWFI